MIDLSRFFGPNAGYVEELYERFRADPNSVDAETRRLFEQLASANGAAGVNGSPAAPAPLPAPTAPAGTAVATRPAAGVAGGGAGRGAPLPPRPSAAATAPIPARATYFQAGLGTATPAGVQPEAVAGAVSYARSIRVRGHLAARTDPLGTEPRGDPTLSIAYHHVTEAQLAALPASLIGGYVGEHAASALEAIEALKRIYMDTTGYEFIHVQVPEERRWLAEAVESQRFRPPLAPEAKRQLLERLSQVEGFERYLHRTFPGQRRFSIEGTDMLVPMLDEAILSAAAAGTHEVVMGMAHRGRLNVLAHVLGKPYADIIRKFHSPEHAHAPSESSGEGFSGDVKYHLGARTTLRRADQVNILLTLADNPSHLEFVNPVVEGMARASQDRVERRGAPRHEPDTALPILMHGDAAFPGQGVVAETLNLSALPGYRTGGTVHIIVNNQVGFTTDPSEGRSTHYASDLAKGFEIPIIHVNADDPEACLAAIRLAVAYRYRFHKDFLIDLVGYRRWGHNESDEPAFTQPAMYRVIADHPTVRELWARRLVAEGVVTADEAAAMLAAVNEAMDAARRQTPPVADAAGARPAEPSRSLNGNGRQRAFHLPSNTAVPAPRLAELNEQLLDRPAGFRQNPKLDRLLQRRREAFAGEGAGRIEWAHAEALAFASILADGTAIRLTGQDVERGTFSQRHLVLHDPDTGHTFIPLQALPAARASFALYNSPLSEMAPLGFEYGYSVQAPKVLVLWEAQFGDFANGGQVIIDQFIASAYAKWGQEPSLVLLLPHGNEGQGPEHSSARLERYLQLAADGNLIVANCSTAAQYFHLLRAQAATLGHHPRPLVLMTPKSLLRHPRAASTVEELATGRFYPVLDDPTMTPERRAGVRRLILCSGKVYVDLVESKPDQAAPGGDGQPASTGADRAAVAIARLERLYPFPAEELRELIAGYPALREVVWLQEEPRNMGAWCFIAPRLREVLTELAADPAEREAARLGEDGGLPARAFAGLPLRYIGRPERSSPAEGAVERFTVNQEQLVAAAYDLDPRPRAATYVSHESATDVQPAAVGVLVSD